MDDQATHPFDVKMYKNFVTLPGFRVNRLAAGLDYEVCFGTGILGREDALLVVLKGRIRN